MPYYGPYWLRPSDMSPSTDRRLDLSLYQRVLLSSLLAQQTPAKLSKALYRDSTEDERVALFSVLRKVRASPEDLAPYKRRLGADGETIDIELLRRQQVAIETVPIRLDGYESRMLHAFLDGWLRTEAALGDRDWASGILLACESLERRV